MLVKDVGILISHGIEKYGAGVLGVDTALNFGCCAAALYSAGKFIQAARNGDKKKAWLWGAVGGSVAVLGVMNAYNTWKEVFEEAMQFQNPFLMKTFYNPFVNRCFKICNLFECKHYVVDHTGYTQPWNPACDASGLEI